MFVPQKHLYLWYNARLCALCEYSCRSREQSPQSFIFFTAFTLGRVLQSCSSFSLSLCLIINSRVSECLSLSLFFFLSVCAPAVCALTLLRRELWENIFFKSRALRGMEPSKNKWTACFCDLRAMKSPPFVLSLT